MTFLNSTSVFITFSITFLLQKGSVLKLAFLYRHIKEAGAPGPGLQKSKYNHLQGWASRPGLESPWGWAETTGAWGRSSRPRVLPTCHSSSPLLCTEHHVYQRCEEPLPCPTSIPRRAHPLLAMSARLSAKQEKAGPLSKFHWQEFTGPSGLNPCFATGQLLVPKQVSPASIS